MKKTIISVSMEQGSAEMDLGRFDGYLEHFLIKTNAQVEIELTIVDEIDILLFKGWLTTDTYLPLRSVPMNYNNAALAYQATKYALQGNIMLHARGTPGQELAVTICVSSEVDDVIAPTG